MPNDFFLLSPLNIIFIEKRYEITFLFGCRKTRREFVMNKYVYHLFATEKVDKNVFSFTAPSQTSSYIHLHTHLSNSLQLYY